MDSNSNKRTCSNIQTVIPNSIFVDILFKLTTKEIAICKCVCKAWHQIISDPEFAMLHFAQQQEVNLMIRPTNLDYLFFYLFDQESQDQFHDFQLCTHKYGLKSKINLDMKFILPQPHLLPRLVNEDNIHQIHERSTIVKQTNSSSSSKSNKSSHILMDFDSMSNSYINSCNGLLCFTGFFRPIVVWNPVTDEFITLPLCDNQKQDESISIYYGLGFSPKNNRYKFLRASYRLGAEICMVETGSWTKLVLDAPPPFDHEWTYQGNSIYVNGALYWMPLIFSTTDDNSSLNKSIVCFDMDIDQFSSVPLPPISVDHNRPDLPVHMGVLRKKLCLFDAYNSFMNVWELMKNGLKCKWIKMLSFPIEIPRNWQGIGSFKPIRYFDDGTLIMRHKSYGGLIFYYPQQNKVTFRYLKLHNYHSNVKLECLSYIPSFISLKHIIKPGSNVKVFGINSRFVLIYFNLSILFTTICDKTKTRY